MRDPGDFDPAVVGVEAPADHQGWRVGEDVYPVNPSVTLPGYFLHVAMLYAACRPGGFGGPGHLPRAGGYADQSAWLMDAFAIIGKEWREEDARAAKIRGRKPPQH